MKHQNFKNCLKCILATLRDLLIALCFESRSVDNYVGLCQFLRNHGNDRRLTRSSSQELGRRSQNVRHFDPCKHPSRGMRREIRARISTFRRQRRSWRDTGSALTRRWISTALWASFLGIAIRKKSYCQYRYRRSIQLWLSRRNILKMFLENIFSTKKIGASLKRSKNTVLAVLGFRVNFLKWFKKPLINEKC